jgi:hypothetical protein
VVHHDSNININLGFSICPNPPLLRDATATNQYWGIDEPVAVINILKLLSFSFRVNNNQPKRLSISSRVGENCAADKTNLSSSGSIESGL